MKRTVLSLAVLGTLSSLPSLSAAQAAPAASPLTGNVTLTSDYRFRGISQSFKLPALQGGFDYAGPGGFYLGNWNSSISGNQYPNGASLEMDFYGGYKVEIAKDVTLDVGALYYYYPGAFYNVPSRQKFNNFEVYAGVSSGPLSVKVFYAVSDLFGTNSATGPSANGDSKGSYYIDANYSVEIMPKVTLGAHVGYQSVKNYSDLSYTDYKLGLTYDMNGWMLGANVIGTNALKSWYAISDASGKSKRLGETGLVLSLSKTF
jgi:uncharacterized protein (TIGR02001 family)